MPPVPVWPEEFGQLNETHLEKVSEHITNKSIFLEKTFLYLIKLILFRINDKYSFKEGDQIYDFFNIPIGLEPNKDTDGEAKHDGRSIFQKYLVVIYCNIILYYLSIYNFFVDDIILPAAHPTSKLVDDWCMKAFRFYNYFYTKALINMMSTTFNTMAAGFSTKE